MSSKENNNLSIIQLKENINNSIEFKDKNVVLTLTPKPNENYLLIEFASTTFPTTRLFTYKKEVIQKDYVKVIRDELTRLHNDKDYRKLVLNNIK